MFEDQENMTSKRVIRSLAHYENVTLDVHERDEKGRTFLHVAANEGNITLVDYMIYHGADLNATDAEGRTPLHNAASGGELPVVVQLVFNGAYICPRDNQQRTPLHEAALGNHPGTVNYLLSMGSDIEPKDVDGKIPLDLATDANVAKFLKEWAERRQFYKERERLQKMAQNQTRQIIDEKRREMDREALKEQRSKRDAPNPPSSSSLSICEWTRQMISTGGESSVGTQQKNVDLNQVNNLLMLAGNCRVFKGSRRAYPSPQQTLINRVDKMAIHAVYNFLSE